MMHASMNRLGPKHIIEEIADIKENILENFTRYRDETILLNAEISEHTEFAEVLENKKRKQLKWKYKIYKILDYWIYKRNSLKS